jgi:hypothetical protein
MKPKRGDVREDGWRFWKRSGIKEYWFSPEDYEAKAQKALESQRAHYERNKEAVKKKTKAYKEKKKPAPKPKPYKIPAYKYQWRRDVEEDLPPDYKYRYRKSFVFFVIVSNHGIRVEISPKELYLSDFLTADHDDEDENADFGCVVENLIRSRGEDFVRTDVDRYNSCKSWLADDLTTITKELVEDIKQSIVALIESSLSPREGRRWRACSRFPDPEIEESGDLSLILRQRFDPLFDAPLSSFSGSTSPLHPKPDLF